MLRRYIHGDQVDEPWVQYNTSAIGDAHRKFLHADHQGSIIAITNTHGAAVNTFEYDVYGIPAAKNIERFGYTGQLYFKGLGLYYYKARIYHPKLGRFLQTDPVGYEDQMNLYAYVGNDPLNMVDPTGKVKQGIKKNLARSVTMYYEKVKKLQENKVKGKVGEQKTREKLGDDIAGEQITLETKQGDRARVDFVKKDKKVVETKTGDAKLSKGQEKIKEAIDKKQEVIPRGKNAQKAGLEPNTPIKLKDFCIDRPC